MEGGRCGTRQAPLTNRGDGFHPVDQIEVNQSLSGHDYLKALPEFYCTELLSPHQTILMSAIEVPFGIELTSMEKLSWISCPSQSLYFLDFQIFLSLMFLSTIIVQVSKRESLARLFLGGFSFVSLIGVGFFYTSCDVSSVPDLFFLRIHRL